MKAIGLSALCLCLLVGWASSQDFAWKMGKTYTYMVRGRLMTGLSEVNTQYSGMEMDYKIMLTRKDRNVVILKPLEFKIVEVHDVLNGGWRDANLEGMTPVELEPEFRTFLESPIELTLNRGVIESIKVEQSLPTWAVNIKKAQASHFVLDTTGVKVVLEGNLNRKIDHVHSDYTTLESGRFFETIETTVHGECKTYYTVSQNEAFVKPFPFQRQAMPGDSSSEESSEESMERHTGEKKMLGRELSWHRTWHEYCNEGDQVFEIIKSVNFTSCNKKPVYGVLSPAASTNARAGDNMVGSFGLRAVVSRFLACGVDRKQFTILKIRQEEQVNVGLHQTEKLIAGSIKNLTLIDIMDMKTLPMLQNPTVIPNLVYKFPRNKLHTHGMDIKDGDVLPKPNLVDAPLNTMLISPVKIDEMKRRVEILMHEIVTDLMNKENTKDSLAEKETLSKITTVAKILRYCNYQDIQEIYVKLNKRTTVEEKFCHHILLNTIAIAGTNPNIKFLLDLIRKHDIKGEHAVQILMTLPLHIRTPTKELLREYFKLVKILPVEIGNRQLKTTGLLSFTTLLHQACVNTNIRNTRYPVQIYGQFCDEKFVEQEFLDFFIKELEKIIFTENTDEVMHWKVVYLTALGNIGHPAVIPLVQRIMDNCINPFIKVKAVFVLKKLIVSRSNQNLKEESRVRGMDRVSVDCLTDEVIEKRVLPILVSVAFDKGEHPHVRMAAISLLMYTTNADVTIWQQLAYLTWFEVSEEVRTFICTSFRNLAWLDQPAVPIHWKLQKKARFVLSLCKPIKTLNWMKSHNIFDSVHLESHLSSFFYQLSTFGAKDSWIPDDIYFRNFRSFGDGALGYNPLELSIHGHSIQKLLDHFLEKIWVPTTGERQAHEDIDKIRELLGIVDRKQTDKVVGSIYVKIHNEMERLFTLNKEKIDRLMKDFTDTTLPKLRDGLPVNWQKTLHMVEHVTEFPSLFGIPIMHKYEMPLHMSVRGNLKWVVENNVMQLQADLHPIYAWKMHHKVSFKVPFLHKKYQCGIQQHLVVEFPFRCLIGRGEHGLFKLALTPTRLHDTTPTGELNLVTFHQKPYTAIIKDAMWPIHKTEAGIVKPIHRALIDMPHKVDHNFGEKTLGWWLRYEAETEYKPETESISGWMRYWTQFKTPMGLWNLGYMGNPLVVRSMRKLSIDLSKTETKTLIFMLGGRKKMMNTEAENRGILEERNHVLTMIGIKRPIVPVHESRGIQHVLVKGTPSTVMYLVHLKLNRDLVVIRTAIGEPCKELVTKLPQDEPWTVPIRDFIMGSTVKLTEMNYCVEVKKTFEWPEWTLRDLVVLRKKLLAEDLVVKVKSEINFGRTCTQMNHKVKMDSELKRGHGMTEWARDKSPLAKKCIEDEKKGFSVSRVCLRLVREEAAVLNEGKMEITWTENLPVPFKRWCFMLQDILKNTLWNYMHHERFPVEGVTEERHMVIDWHMKHDKEFVHLNIRKPQSHIMFKNIRTNWWIKWLLPITPIRTLPEHIIKRVIHPIMKPVCTLETNYINTFDNVTFKFDKDITKNCEHVLTQDCSGKWPMAVLVRDIHTKNKIVTVLLDHATKIEILTGTRSPVHRMRNEGENLKVRVNGKDVTTFPKIIRSNDQRPDSNKYICKIEKMVTGGVQVITPKLKVATDCNRVVVFGDNAYRNRTCGLCGDFDGEKIAEFRSPKDCPLSSGSLLLTSYAFPPVHAREGQCTLKPELKTRVEKEEEDCLKVHTHMRISRPMATMAMTMDMENEEEFRPRQHMEDDDDCYVLQKLVRHPAGLGECHSERKIRTCARDCEARNPVRKLVWFDCVDFRHVTPVSQSVRKQLYVDMPTECVRNW